MGKRKLKGIRDILIDFLTLVDFKQKDNLTMLINLFESSKLFKPTKWQPDDTLPTRKYKHDEVISEILQNGERYIPCLYRTGKYPYEMVFHLDSNLLNPSAKNLNFMSLRMKYPENCDVIPEIFQFSSELAGVCRAVYGSLDFITEVDFPEWTPAILSETDLQKYGLSGLGIRTWFGSHAISQIGLDRLTNCSGTLHQTDWDGCELDLLPEPWQVDNYTDFIKIQAKILTQLEPSGAFGNYASYPLSSLYTPAPSWTPIPLD